MTRIHIVDPATATGEVRRHLETARAQLGAVPNFIRVLANSAAALEGFLALYGATAGLSLDKATQERIALTVAEGNGCDYCVSAHTAIGRHAGLSAEEMLQNRRGTSGDPRAAALVGFARAVNDTGGDVSDADLRAARDAGLTDAQIVEVITVVALNVFTNLLGKSTRVEIDFPRVAPLGASARGAA